MLSKTTSEIIQAPRPEGAYKYRYCQTSTDDTCLTNYQKSKGRRYIGVSKLKAVTNTLQYQMIMSYTKALSTEDAIKAHKRFSPGDRL